MPSSILIVVNDSAQRRYLAAVLRAAGHEPVAVASVPEAIGRLREGGIALMLLDLGMPGLGLEVLRRLGRGYRGHEGQRPPVIVLTADGPMAHVIEAMQADGRILFLAEIGELQSEA